MKYEGIIFDWAGTTVDYGCMAPVRAFDEAFKSFGIEPTMEEIRKPMGMLKIDHVRTMLQMERINNLWKKNIIEIGQKMTYKKSMKLVNVKSLKF